MNNYIDCDDDDLMIWAGMTVVAIALALTMGDPCEDLTQGTDAYWQCVTDSDELDLTPTEGN